jgi:two-component sensor histidine kinase
LFLWRESQVPSVEEPKKQGFGTRLIERGLIGIGGGSTALEFGPDGARCTLYLPLPELLLPNHESTLKIQARAG